MYRSFHNPELTKRLTITCNQDTGEARIRIDPDGIINPALDLCIFDQESFVAKLQPKKIRCSSGTITDDCLSDVAKLNFCYDMVEVWWTQGKSDEDIIHGIYTTCFRGFIENK